MHIVPALVLVIILLVETAVAQSVPGTRDVSASLVFLETYIVNAGSRELYDQGSGFVVSPSGHVITSAHVIPRPKPGQSIEIKIRRQGDKAVDLPANLDGNPDEDNDAALLRVTGLQAVPLCFGDSEKLKPGAALQKFGYPRAGPLASVPGFLSSRSGQVRSDSVGATDPRWWGGKPPRVMWLMSLPLTRGDSGGVVLDGEGFVAGIACCGHRDDQHLSYMVPEITFVGLRRRLSFSDQACASLDRAARNPPFTRSIVGVWEGTYNCGTGNGQIRHTIQVLPDGRMAVQECFKRDFRQGCFDFSQVEESTRKARTIVLHAERVNMFSEPYRLEMTFDASFLSAHGTYDGHRTCRSMDLRRRS